MTRTLTLALLLVSTLALAACGNTFRGMGRDVESLGERMQSTSAPRQ